MIGRSSDWDDCGEKGNVPVAIDGLLCMDCGTSCSDIDIAEVGWLSEVDGHSAVVGTVVLLTKMGVFKGMSMSGVDHFVQQWSLLGSWGEDVELMAGPDGEISEEVIEWIERGVDGEGVECLVGHAGGDLSRGRVLILLEVLWKSDNNSRAWRSSVLTYESWAGE